MGQPDNVESRYKAMVAGRTGANAILKKVRRICLSLPDATEKLAWGAPTFRVGGKKMFAMFANDHHGDGRVALWLNAPPGVQEILVSADPARFFVPPYQGPFGWVGVRVDRDPDWDEVRELVEEAYRTTDPARTSTPSKKRAK